MNNFIIDNNRTVFKTLPVSYFIFEDCSAFTNGYYLYTTLKNHHAEERLYHVGK